MAMPSSSSTFTYVFNYDVFLSFRGIDTRHGFTGYLYKALHESGIHTFIDDEELQRGEEITPSLIKSIEESRIAIIVLSTNYASSSFCLEELSSIIDCVNGKGRLVLPVFYEVDPSDMRKHTGTYGEALAMHEERFKDNKDRLLKWKMALQQVANLSGFHFKHGDGYEYQFIGRIVELVSSKINRAPLHVADYPVGLESRVLEVKLLLDVGSNDGIHMVGIYGMGGVGKTTLALAVYNLIADNFDGLCFLENVRENSNKKGLRYLQEILLSEMVGVKKIELKSVKQGISIIQHRLQQKKVLLILDDVDKIEQLEALVGGSNWFGRGSRVIITTQDIHLLACHGVERTYEVDGLNNTEALELFRWKAFKNKQVDPSYNNILNRAVTYACGLPLALEVIGCNLFGKSVDEWNSALHLYDRIPNKKIQEILRVSFDALEEEEKSVFLDIACCFKGYELGEVEDILCAHHRDCMKYHIGVLADKSLIKISSGLVTLHDLIENMGKEVVRQESPKEPGKRSRLWFSRDIVQVLEENTGTNEIEIIYLGKEVIVEWDGKAFEKMKNLKTLIVRKGHFSKGPEHLPNSLRVLEWQGCPSQYMPSDFHPRELAICKINDSSFTSHELGGLIKKFVNLKVLNFDNSKCISQIPDVSGLPNLEKISSQSCRNLITIHDSVGLLDKLRYLNFSGCIKLRGLPPLKLTSLEELHLSYCCRLESFPEILGKMENIKNLDLYKTPIKELPSSFQDLTRLRSFYLGDQGIVQLSSNIVVTQELDLIVGNGWKVCPLTKQERGEERVSSMVSSSLGHLELPWCNLSDELLAIGLTWFFNLKELNLSFSSFTVIPECIKECLFLNKLNLDDCELLREVRGIPPNLKVFSARNCNSLTSLSINMLLNQELHEAGNTEFFAPRARIPEWFEHRITGRPISLWFRNKFPAIALCLLWHYALNFMPTVIINGSKLCLDPHLHNCEIDVARSVSYGVYVDHTYIFDLQKVKRNDNLDGLSPGNKWNHMEVKGSIGTECGIHVFKQKSNTEDIRLADPYGKRKFEDDLNRSELQNLPLLKRHRLVDAPQ